MSIRVERVRKKIRFLVANVLQREVKDPRKGFVTVTRVDLAADFSRCTVYVSVLGEPGEVSKTMHMLEDARGFVQTRVAAGLSTRTTPHLTWELDEGAQRSVEVSALLSDLAAERAEREARQAEANAEADGDVQEGEGDAQDGEGDEIAPAGDA